MTALKCYWHIPPADLILSSNDVHLWRAKLDQSDECVKQLTQMLSDEEQRKTERFHFDKDRKRFIVTRGVLRTILSRYLGVEPNRLQFGYSSHGKPYLAENRMVKKFVLTILIPIACHFMRLHEAVK